VLGRPDGSQGRRTPVIQQATAPLCPTAIPEALPYDNLIRQQRYRTQNYVRFRMISILLSRHRCQRRKENGRWAVSIATTRDPSAHGRRATEARWRSVALIFALTLSIIHSPSSR
jgi:hypothetical protein